MIEGFECLLNSVGQNGESCRYRQISLLLKWIIGIPGILYPSISGAGFFLEIEHCTSLSIDDTAMAKRADFLHCVVTNL